MIRRILQEEIQKIHEVKIRKVNLLSNSTTEFIYYKGTIYMFNQFDKSKRFKDFLYRLSLEIPNAEEFNVPLYDGYNEHYKTDYVDTYLEELSKIPYVLVGYITRDSKSGERYIAFKTSSGLLNYEYNNDALKLLKDLNQKGNIHYVLTEKQKIVPIDEYLNSFNDYINKEQPIHLPKIVYHGTTDKNLPIILKSGLKPVENTNFKNLNHMDHVFFTTNLMQIAKGYADNAANRQGSEPIALLIDTSKIDNNKVTYDFDFYRQFIRKGNKPYDELLKNSTYKKTPIDTNTTPNFNHAKLGYQGIIYPRSFVGIYDFNTDKTYGVKEYLNLMNS